MSSSTTPAVAAFTPDHLSSSEQLCYVHCKICDTVLAVSVPCSSLFKTVTVRCGHCTNLLSVNMCSMFLPAPANNQLHLGHPLFTPHHDLLEEIRHVPATMNMNMNMMMLNHQQPTTNPSDHTRMPSVRGVDHLYHRHQDLPATPPVVNRPPEKRQRVPSAYNRFIKDEIQRIKAGNPDISHREAFSAAAKNWAHFPHIHFGLMPSDQPVKKTSSRQQEGEEAMKEGLFGPANIGVTTPY